MAMQTHVLENGQWVRRTVGINEVLARNSAADQDDHPSHTSEPSIEQGLLTQTVVRSPLVRWMLPVKLRGPQYNDVAFVGDSYVEILELRTGARLSTVFLQDFAPRICSASVIGTMENFEKETAELHRTESASHQNGTAGNAPASESKLEDGNDVLMQDPHGTTPLARLPPQLIVLQLVSGESVFFFLRETSRSTWELVIQRYQPSNEVDENLHFGTSMSVNPSSRFISLGCSEGLFAVYTLRSRKEISKIYHENAGTLQVVQSERRFPLPAIIYKQEFLHPEADDPGHIILLLLLVAKGKMSMVLYQWNLGDDLVNIRPMHISPPWGHRAEALPQLLIPLRLETAFLLASEDGIRVCEKILTGSLEAKFLNQDRGSQTYAPTRYHTSEKLPLYANWARPPRAPAFAAVNDYIYIVREDGAARYLEIGEGTGEVDFLTEHMVAGFACNIGTAFACMEDYKEYKTSDDIAIGGGDGAVGKVYRAIGREPFIFIRDLQNWSPAIDVITTTPVELRGSPEKTLGNVAVKTAVRRRDKIFIAAGKGNGASISEMRYGLEANVALVMVYSGTINRAWALPATADPAVVVADGLLLLLSLPMGSGLLRLTHNAVGVEELSQVDTGLDLASRTIAAAQNAQDNTIIQVTERSIVILDGTSSSKCVADDLLGFEDVNAAICNAVIYQDAILFIAYLGNERKLRILKRAESDVDDRRRYVPPEDLLHWNCSNSEMTCLALSNILGAHLAVMASWDGNKTRLHFPIQHGHLDIPTIRTGFGANALVSMEIVDLTPTRSNVFGIVCGTQNGVIQILEIGFAEGGWSVLRSTSNRIGRSAVMLSRDESCNDVLFVNCDSRILRFTLPSALRLGKATNRFGWNIDEIWLTDMARPAWSQPDINSIARLSPHLSGATGNGLLMVADDTLLLSELCTWSNAVPRQLKIGGTPSRLLYSETLGVLIVAAVIGGLSTILCLDPDTGEDLSIPTRDKGRVRAEFAGGLGKKNEYIHCLCEWSLTKSGKLFPQLVVGTSTGRLLILSAERLPEPGKPDKIRFYTRHQIKQFRPVLAAVGTPTGLFHCHGNHLSWQEVVDKEFKTRAYYTLASPATALFYEPGLRSAQEERGLIFAVTSEHSLQVLEVKSDLVHNKRTITLTHSDTVARHALHLTSLESQIRLSGSDWQAATDRASDGHLPEVVQLHLVSDKKSKVTGLLARTGTVVDSIETRFEAQLGSSIVRLRKGNCRPIWSGGWLCAEESGEWETSNSAHDRASDYPDHDFKRERDLLGVIGDDRQILGLSFDGSITQFTVIGIELLAFLRFIVRLNQGKPEHSDIATPLAMFDRNKNSSMNTHIDGNVLKQCLVEERLEGLLIGAGSITCARFVELLHKVHHSAPLAKGRLLEDDIRVAYQDLEFLLRPAL